MKLNNQVVRICNKCGCFFYRMKDIDICWSCELKPKSKAQMIKDLNHLRKTLGLNKTDGSMSVTHEVVKTKGSLLDGTRFGKYTKEELEEAERKSVELIVKSFSNIPDKPIKLGIDVDEIHYHFGDFNEDEVSKKKYGKSHSDGGHY